jgi:thiamine-monophosphate kinase
MSEVLSEWTLIERYFACRTSRHALTRLGIGDDCALLAVPDGHELAVTTDTLVEGVHFLPDVRPDDLGYKSLAVNLSDLAAMGAEPVAVMLALTLPRADAAWLEDFAAGFFDLAGQHGVELIGGDTTRGPLTIITVQALGIAPQGAALRRAGARPGDDVFLTGRLGEAGLGLAILQGKSSLRDAAALRHLLRPEPRVAAGLALRGLASACIDVSDGLAADLGHLLAASGVGACLEWEALPLPQILRQEAQAGGDWRFPLECGDDYELCFTAPAGNAARIEQALAALDCPLSRIGRIESEPGLRILRQGRRIDLELQGYRHF